MFTASGQRIGYASGKEQLVLEGEELTVRGDRVFLKTVEGLEPVHGLLRRLDDDGARAASDDRGAVERRDREQVEDPEKRVEHGEDRQERGQRGERRVRRQDRASFDAWPPRAAAS